MGVRQVVGEPKKRRSRDQQLDETEALDQWLERQARAEAGLDNDEDDPEPLPDVADLHYPRWYVQRAWLREREHGDLPHGGALNTLPMPLFRDLNTLDERYAHFQRLAWKEKREQMDSGTGGRKGRDPSLKEGLGEDYDDLFSSFGGAATDPVSWG